MGEIFRSGTARPVSGEELKVYEQLSELQSRQPVPVLQSETSSHHYLMFSLLDGTGQNAESVAQELTNVGHLRAQLGKLALDPTPRVGFHYVKGIGTQKNSIVRHWDAAVPFTWDDKVVEAYRAIAIKGLEWKERDPEARISVVYVGYSRGAVLASGLTRLVDHYGIADPDGLKFGRDEHGNVTVISSKPPLVAPGQTAQVIALFDPVGTNLPRDFDVRPAPSVISGFSLLAADERREAFPHKAILDIEMTADGRFIGARVPGGHSNVGGGNYEDGLEILAFNSVVDYLNGISDRPLFEHRPLPADPARYTVHQARGLTALPGLDDDGERDLREELANCKVVDPCRDAEPIDLALAQRFEYRLLKPTAPRPALLAAESVAVDGGTRRSPDDPAHPDHAWLQPIRDGVRGLDRDAGKAYDEGSERLSRYLLAASREARLERIDHVVLGSDGRRVFAVEGGMGDPWRRWAAVEVAQAVRTPVADSDVRLEAANERLSREAAVPEMAPRARGEERVAQGP